MRMVGMVMAILFILFIGNAYHVYGESEHDINTLNLRDTTDQIDLDSYIEIFVDESRTYTIDDIATGQFDGKFTSYQGIGSPNFGYTSSNYWVRFQIDNYSSQENWLLEVDTPKINRITLYSPILADNFEEQTIGNFYPFSNREVRHRNLIYNMSVNKGPSQTFYLRFTTGSSMQIPLTIWDSTVFEEKSQFGYLLFGTLIGISVVMALYNLFLYFSVGDRSYIYYVLFVLLNALLYLSDTGLAFQLFWPEAVSWNLRAIVVFMGLGNAFALLFTRSFLHTDIFIPKIDRLYKFFIVISVCASIWGIFSVTYAMYAALFCVIITVFLVIPTALWGFKKGYRPARIFALAWSIFLCGVLISILVEIGAIPLSAFTKHAWLVTTVCEVVLLSFALGAKYKVIQEEKEKAEQDARNSQKQAMDNLKKVDKLKDEFLANTSHELRTPLNGIIGIAETLREGIAGKMTEEISDHLWMIILSGRRLSNLVNDILDFSKLKNDDLFIKLEPVNIMELTNVVLMVCQPLVKDKPIKLINQIKAGTPMVMADKDRLQQILYNLIGNAIKYTSYGKVVVSTNSHSNYLEINVSDTGQGIPENQLKTIFEPFHQGGQEVFDGVRGTGIGLNITKDLIELHHGEIHVSSTFGHGTIFTFTLPISEIQNRLVEEVGSSSTFIPQHNFNEEAVMITTTSEKSNQQNAKILIADDEQVNLQVLRNHLVLEGYEVIAVTNGKDVINYVKEHTVDMLILDIMMPKLSGYEVCRYLRKRYSLNELPILMLTAKNQVRDKITSFEVGANDYLSKPCNKKELLARVNTLIQLHRLNKELLQINHHLDQKVKERTKALHKVNQHLLDANTRLEDMAQSRRKLLGDIAHELGTPVTLIQGYVQGIQEGLITIDHPHYLEMVHHKVNILNRLITDLSDLSKLEAGKITLYLDSIRIDLLIDQIYRKLELDITQRGRIFTTLNTERSTPSTNLFCNIDIERMDQVFSNLVWNAIKHTSPTDGEISVTVSVDDHKQELIIGIHDNGEGISEETSPFIFERFNKAVIASQDDTVSTGLGLAIAKEIIEAHKGRIWVDNQPHKGNSFYIALPVHVD